MRQSDPLSPLLFCFVEEVLSRRLTKLVEQGIIKPISSPRGVPTPTHLLYADDILIFCKGTSSCLGALMKFLEVYGEASGQLINKSKCRVFIGNGALHRHSSMTLCLGFIEGSAPFLYLGVPIFKGKPRKAYFQHIVDKEKSKLSGISFGLETSLPVSLLQFLGLSFVSCLIKDNVWHIPTSFASAFPDITHDILQLSLPVEDTVDVLVWPFSMFSHLSFIDAYYYFKPATSDVSWAHHLWKHYIPLKLSTLTWKLLLNVLPIDDNLQKREVCWYPPPPLWIKLNTDRLAKGNPGPVVVGGGFRNCRGFVKSIFSFNIGVQSAFYAELLAVIFGIEQAWGKGWFQIWLESDSLLVIHCLSNPDFISP
ncbi:hypothetical protein L1049_013470 [Liquidambar formosana]|uniref:Reverse transcriptase domain-containing protein n=1 Tax=Liquidambar formosana TaxID=63359 RepID=A0AAP0WY60_LIQFO